LYEEGGTERGLNLYLYDGSLYVGGWNVEGWEAGTYLSVSIAGYAGGWHHAALVLDASGPVLEADVLRGYLDGSPVGSGQGRSLVAHGDDIGIGRADGYTQYHTGHSGTDADGFAGKIDEVRVYNLALSDAEIAALAASVTLTSPSEGAIVRTDLGATMAAQVSDTEGLVRVEFYAETDKVGEDTAAPYEALWLPGQTGSVALTAKGVYTGLAVDSAPVNVTVAYPADADFDDDVDLDDLTILGTHYNTPSGAAWPMGDFNFDGAVDLDDLTILGAYYNTSWSPPPGTLAPGAAMSGVTDGTAPAEPAPQTVGYLPAYLPGVPTFKAVRRQDPPAEGPAALAARPGASGDVDIAAFPQLRSVATLGAGADGVAVTVRPPIAVREDMRPSGPRAELIDVLASVELRSPLAEGVAL
ncbi:MAG TPA: Ig-like domain-containing protein, partial [Phycisphaerae bacterium]|nr:Ig-like domain-containing protein [Phycisphaerae bacterium]